MPDSRLLEQLEQHPELAAEFDVEMERILTSVHWCVYCGGQGEELKAACPVRPTIPLPIKLSWETLNVSRYYDGPIRDSSVHLIAHGVHANALAEWERSAPFRQAAGITRTPPT